MQNFNPALGVECPYCHVQGDFAERHESKEGNCAQDDRHGPAARHVFPQVARVFFPPGINEVDSSTCHRGSAKPETKAPKEFSSRNESLGAPPPPVTPGVNLKVLPVDTRVHGEGSVMHEFQDALKVDCGYGHGAGKPFEADENPRKEIARRMIPMVRQIDSNFPGTAIFLVGNQQRQVLERL